METTIMGYIGIIGCRYIYIYNDNQTSNNDRKNNSNHRSSGEC